jgi:catechol 2,3-dioxygenase-like lactoylglutathione lyase family enzyme
MLQYVHHFSLGVRDFEKSADFYKNFIGFREIPRPALDFPGLWLKLANVQLHLIQRGDEYPDDQGLPWAVHTAFQTANLEDLDRMEQKLVQKEIPYKRVVQDDSGINQIFFKDPDGYNIEFGYYPD